MRVLITGGTGFVGSHMIDHILKIVPDVQIFASRRWRSRDENIKHLYGDFRVVFVESDLTDRGSLQNLIAVAKPDYVFHFAAQSFPASSFLTPVYTLTTNVLGTVNLLEELRLAKQLAGIDPTIVSVSSSEVYGMPTLEEIPMRETNPLRAANPYSISKVGHDLLSQYYQKAFGLKIIVTRMFSHEGKRRGKLFALSSFANQIVLHEKMFRGGILAPITFEIPGSSNVSTEVRGYPIYVGNLDSLRTYAHIDSAVKAYWLCATKGKVGEVYNIGGKETCTVREALEKLLSKSIIPREDFRIVVDPKLVRPTDITLQIPDCTKFKNDTGWEPEKGLEEITMDLLDYWRGMLQ